MTIFELIYAIFSTYLIGCRDKPKNTTFFCMLNSDSISKRQIAFWLLSKFFGERGIICTLFINLSFSSIMRSWRLITAFVNITQSTQTEILKSVQIFIITTSPDSLWFGLSNAASFVTGSWSVREFHAKYYSEFTPSRRKKSNYLKVNRIQLWESPPQKIPHGILFLFIWVYPKFIRIYVPHRKIPSENKFIKNFTKFILCGGCPPEKKFI